MVSSARGTPLLLAYFAVTLYILPIIHSLSIPPPQISKVIQREDSSEEASTTQIPTDNNGLDGLVLDETADSSTDNTNQHESSPGKRKPVLELVDIVFQPFRPPSIFVMDVFAKSNRTSNDTSGNSSEEGNNSDSSEESSTTSGRPNDNIGSNEENSQEKHRGSVNVDSDGRDNNDLTNTANGPQDNGISLHKPRIGTIVVQRGDPTSQMTSSSLNAQKQFSMDNNNENSDDDAREMSDKRNNPADASNDDETASTRLSVEDITFTTTSPTKSNDNTDGSSDGNNNQRRKRETHQMGNISSEDHDHDDTPSSPSKNPTGRFQPDDMAKSNNGDNVSSSNGTDSSPRRTSTSEDDASADEHNDTEEDDGQHETHDGHKSGTVKVFLEILQLIPLSNSSTLTTTSDSNNVNDDDDESTTPFLTPMTTPPALADDIEDNTGTTATVVHSTKANSNQKISKTNSLTVGAATFEKKEPLPEETHEVVVTKKRVVRSATAKPESEKKGNPSTSPTTSASPSSRATSKPLTGKDAPAAPSPSANTFVTAAKKASSTAPDDAEGPPLENVTEPLGKSDVDAD